MIKYNEVDLSFYYQREKTVTGKENLKRNTNEHIFLKNGYSTLSYKIEKIK
jgi:hypothetical protein